MVHEYAYFYEYIWKMVYWCYTYLHICLPACLQERPKAPSATQNASKKYSWETKIRKLGWRQNFDAVKFTYKHL